MTGKQVGALIGNVGLALVCLLLGALHLEGTQQSGRWVTSVLLVVQQGLLMVLFLFRRRTVETSARVYDWVIAVTGSFIPLAMRERTGPPTLAWLGEPVQGLGLILAIVASGFLGRSMGIVAANRGVKTGGVYGIVRHPMYAGHVLGYLGFLTANPSWWNAGITAITVAFMAARAHVEERLLSRDPAYRAYLSRTRWRLVPYLY
jgi:protein-S-isoprenylcysteine O-methyltransferase Ste14